MKINFGQVNFGSFVPTRIFLDGKELNLDNDLDKEEADRITTLLCRNLRKEVRAQSDDEQRQASLLKKVNTKLEQPLPSEKQMSNLSQKIKELIFKLHEMCTQMADSLGRSSKQAEILNNGLEEQQRRHFDAFVKDWDPIIGNKKFYDNKDGTTPKANVTTINDYSGDGTARRFLVTGDDIALLEKLGLEKGTYVKDRLTPDYYRMSDKQKAVYLERVKKEAEDRRALELKRAINVHGINKTLCISAVSLPTTNTTKKKPRYDEMYKINLIDFKA